ncbi:osmotically inducible protein C [Desulfuromonas versatilis]|uniref:Osmotically inducible protein C n=1 Tax=Desulfuromonas versatilis TaxID=2802975 RepID=A0ABN6DYK5_9BACT|nr:OsmC family protein [Desulfuromonas versatilis]BCR05046.1 osmotically inducible protein C [Desulfuromonas versatilis]
MMATGKINGVDVDRLASTIDAIKGDPGIASFRFRATNRWDEGGHTETTIHDFYGARQDLTHQRDFHIHADEPDLLLGKDMGANPVELALSALASCLTTSLVYHAAARGITVRAVESDLDGELDLRGFLGLSDKVRNGYKNINVNFRVDADADQSTIDELIQLAQKRSPVFDIISNPVSIKVNGGPMRSAKH